MSIRFILSALFATAVSAGVADAQGDSKISTLSFRALVPAADVSCDQFYTFPPDRVAATRTYDYKEYQRLLPALDSCADRLTADIKKASKSLQTPADPAGLSAYASRLVEQVSSDADR